MQFDERDEIIKHIKLGTNEVFFYPYNDGKDPLPLRPISSYEMDQSFYKILEKTDPKIGELLIKIKLKLIDKDREINILSEDYLKLQKALDEFDYWIVYHAMKDFQGIEFEKPDFEDGLPIGFKEIRKMSDVHEIANTILDSSYRKNEVIKEVFKDDLGREVAYLVFYLNVPLSDIGKMTKLQREYLLYAKAHLKKIVAGEKKKAGYMVSGEKMTLKEFLDRMGISYGNG
ncbi:MAG: hypothetical protein ACTSQY_00100 [Candidatus Odinarchaeia archaeon]|nr:MAG: hypothetical protein [Lokiarchaeota virus Fenrir Meg22_1012]URC17199.1 MAG: hypothetical protein [Lokiarchaeota virus Fenrir Meg22_1214]